MNKYKFIGTEQDLIDNGFYLCTDKQDNIDDKDYLRDMNEDVQLYISLGFEPFKKTVVNNKATTLIENFKVEEYIKDLIDLELVKKENKK